MSSRLYRSGPPSAGGEPAPYGDTYEHPMFRYLTNLIPRRLRALFRLCEQVFMGPHATSGIRKIAEYPVTDPEIFSDSENDRKAVEDYLKNIFQIKREITRSMYNMFVYGNDFTSFHRPFIRYAQCGHEDCGNEININNVKEFKYSYQNVTVRYTCKECGRHTSGKLVDRRSKDITKCAIVHWDPKRIDIDPCVITNENEYYYRPSPEEVTRVQEGNRHLVAKLPMGLLKAIAEDVRFQFRENELFHMKVDSPSGIENHSGWGIPVLVSAIETYLYISVMRKGNESTAMERIESMRIVYPATVTANGDPSYQLSMSSYMNRLQEDYEYWRRRDRNMVMFSPLPVGVAQIGGDGRPLLTNQEIQSAENNILAILGIPREFVYGGVSYGPGSGAVLRQIENQLVAHISQTSGLLQWLTDKICAFKGLGRVEARLGKFTIQDDGMNKQAAQALYQQGELSAESFMKLHGYDRDEEQDRIMEEQLDRARRDKELQQRTEQLQNDIATQAQLQAQQGQGLSYDVNSIMGQASQMVQQMSADPMNAQSILANLQNQDPVMWSVVSKMWEQHGEQARQAARQGGGMM